MSNHDPKCHAYGFGPGQRMDICICTGIRIGRADERERTLTTELRSIIDIEARQALTDLRAKVGGLTKTALLSHKRYWNGETVVRVRDVLALFPEEKSHGHPPDEPDDPDHPVYVGVKS